mmetsp:Transcript_99114/g.285974  ORF Transcript_99114/g.285974 Transcript_99114/m.285974 type:complete len:123 (-) Transcript_99114:60-428(-)
MKVEVEGDVAAFVADPQVKLGFQMGSDTRRLASMVTVDEIKVPSSKDTETVQGAIQRTSPSKMTAVIAAKIAESGTSEYSMTASEMSDPAVSANAVQVDSLSHPAVCSVTFVVAAVGGLSAM